ncbi:oxidoreductase [Zopfochytrium polystomum]|nr:oxidoreductase [Zopfochytrium polystomum]
MLPYSPGEEDEKKLLEQLENEKWNNALTRRTIHYGYEYKYRNRKVEKCEDIPEWLTEITKKLETISGEKMNQIIINEYTRKQGITKHIDAQNVFGDTIVGLSLNDECIMDFKNGNERESVKLERRSLLIMTGEARNKWTHCINPKKQNFDRRISITWRRVRNV